MTSFLRRLFGGASPRSGEAQGTPGATPTAAPVRVDPVRTSTSDHRARDSSDEYFSTMARMEAAIAERKYREASQLARQNIMQVPSFVRATKRQNGSFDIRSIPALEAGGTMLALTEDGDSLEEMKRTVESLPDLRHWKEKVAQHFDDLRLFRDVVAAVRNHPNCLQTSVKDLIGASDGRRVATIVGWLDKAGRIQRTKRGSTYTLALTNASGATAPNQARVISSHRRGDSVLNVAEIDVACLPYVPLPRAPRRWEESRSEGARTASASEPFEVDEADGWQVIRVEQLPKGERPDTAFRQMHPIDTGLLMLDDLGQAEGFGGAPSAALRFDRSGHQVAAAPLRHDVYRVGVNALGRGLIAMSRECVCHAYDDSLTALFETNLREAPEVKILQRRLGIDSINLKNHLRCVALSCDNTRYLLTGVDEAWCIGLDGTGMWGVKLPLKEGWSRVAESTSSVATSAEVERALRAMDLRLPVSPEDIKRRYRQLAKEWHPDLHLGDRLAEEKMKGLTSAMEALTGIDASALPMYTGATFAKDVSRHEIVSDGVRATFSVQMVVSEVHAADWIYAAGFAGRSHAAFLAGYSGRIVHVDATGAPIRAYDIGAVPNRIVDTGDFIYFLTDTRLYVLRGDTLHAVVDTFDQGTLVMAQTGFGLLSSKQLRWFREDGLHLGSLRTMDPIRRVYYRSGTLVVETRQQRATVRAMSDWWESPTAVLT